MTPGSNDNIGPIEYFAGSRKNAFPLTQKLKIKSALSRCCSTTNKLDFYERFSKENVKKFMNEKDACFLYD
ncbi:MAG: hypothetical protein ACKO96_46955, partial [Flammeovirgaceae bacterium]